MEDLAPTELRFEESEQSELGGLPVVKAIWDRLEVGLWFSRSGIMKTRGISTRQLAFFFVIGLIRQWGSEIEMTRKLRDDAPRAKIGEKLAFREISA